MDKKLYWMTGICVAVALIFMAVVSPKSEKEVIQMYEVRITNNHWVAAKRIYFNEIPEVEIITDSERDKIFMRGDGKEVFFDLGTHASGETYWGYSIKAIKRRVKIEE